ncbi:TM2 domain-containing protein [Halorussus salinisoli]|uniref:TM2 domain-containing protein n=1 Tax=Halorussus salinisoli TaxID=2558242 RepID=UPI003742A4E6
MCPECGVSQTEVPSSGGTDRSADEKFCTDCGAVINRDAEICPECGVRQTVGISAASDSDKDQVAAGLLAILLGGVGAHKFYLDDVKMGVVYLCFSWTLVPAIVGLVEGIMYFTKSEEEFQRKYVDG